MLPDPRSDEFWEEEEEKLWNALSIIALGAFLSGVSLGSAQLFAQLSGITSAPLLSLIGEEAILAQAQSFLLNYRLADISNITETTRKAATGLIDDWLMSGENIGALKDSLATLPQLSEGRASVIAVTENTRLISEGKIAAWKESGIIGLKTWIAVLDQKTTPMCRALNGKTATLNGTFKITGEDIANFPGLDDMVAAFGSEFHSPPAHPNCRSDVQPVPDEQALVNEIRKIDEDIS